MGESWCVGLIHHFLRPLGLSWLSSRSAGRITSHPEFEKSEAWGWRPQHSNPCRHIERYKTKSRERVLIADEMAGLGPALASDPEGKVFLVIALTGARVSEITGLKWSYLDLDNGVARLPDSKTGAKTLVLPEPVVEILRDVKGVASSEYVFAQQSKRATSRTWERIGLQLSCQISVSTTYATISHPGALTPTSGSRLSASCWAIAALR